MGLFRVRAANAILLRKEKTTDRVLISGIGTGNEACEIGNEELILRGQGLADAINQASQEAKVEIHETACRVASITGEDYFFSEASLAHIKTLKKLLPKHQLLHTTQKYRRSRSCYSWFDNGNELLWFNKRYLNGDKIICQISNDNSQRGAFIMQENPRQGAKYGS